MAKFGIDMRPPGVLHAMVNACPVFGGALARKQTPVRVITLCAASA